MRKVIIVVFYVLQFNIGFAQNEITNDSIPKKLDEVSVKNTAKAFSNKKGNIKLDVANSIFKAVPSTMDLLAKFPKVQISSDKESLTVVGKGVPLIYIDNQKVSINDLNSLSVEDIKSIEIINNPSTKYEAEGKVVILITRKLSKKEGFKINLTENAFIKKNYNNYLGFNANVKKKNLELKANFNYNQLNIWEKHSINYQISGDNIISNYTVEAYTKRPQFIFGGGLFYKINEDDYFSMNANVRVQKDIFGINTQTFNKQNNIENTVLTNSNNNENRNLTNTLVNYSKKIKPINTQMFTGFQYSTLNKEMHTLVENNFNNSQFGLSQSRNQLFNVSAFSGRTDLEKTFKNDMKLEIGGLFLDANAKTDFTILDFNNNSSKVSNYHFSEQNTAGYSQLSWKIKKIEYSLGFRVENTKILGKYKNESLALVKKNYTDFFPKAQLNLSIDSLKTITLNYSRTIARPNYSTTNQGATYINPYFIYGSNINLDPTINNAIALNFQYKDKSVGINFYKNLNPVYGDFIYDNQQNILTFSEKNFEGERGINLDLTLPFTYKFWTTNTNFSFILNKIKDATAMQNQSKPYFYYYSNHTFKLPKEYTFSLTCWGLTTQKEGIYERRQPEFLMDLALSKTIFKNWDCTLSFNDVFKNMVYKENFTINNISSKSHYLSDTHEIALSIKYSFGKIRDTQFKEKSIDENEN
ncbi:MAG: TonB-dependent receptor [Flavobacterium sp.]